MTFNKLIFSTFIFCFFVPLSMVRGEELSEPAVPLPAGGLSEEESLLKLARTSLSSGHVKTARQTLKIFLRGHKNSPEGWTLLGETYLKTGSFGKARRRFNKAIKFDPHYSPAYMGRGKIFELKNRWDEAANEYRAARLCDSGNPAAQIALEQLAARTASME